MTVSKEPSITAQGPSALVDLCPPLELRVVEYMYVDTTIWFIPRHWKLYIAKDPGKKILSPQIDGVSNLMARDSENATVPSLTQETDRTARVIAMIQNELENHVDPMPTSTSPASSSKRHPHTVPGFEGSPGSRENFSAGSAGKRRSVEVPLEVPPRSSSLRNRESFDIQNSNDTPPLPPQSPKRSLDTSRPHGQRSSLDQPSAPRANRKDVSALQNPSAGRNGLGLNYQPVADLDKLSDRPVNLEGVVDLSKSEDVDVQTHYAPAVTHETVLVDTQEIRQEQVTREIHNHHVFHRILPIVDVQVLPARHFIPAANGGHQEIPAFQVSDRNKKIAEELSSEMAKKLLPKPQSTNGPRQFTAREFHGSEGKFKAYTTPGGIPRTETWWVHPPTVETGGRDTGQTKPFHLGSENPADDGLRDVLPMKDLARALPILPKRKDEPELGNR